MLAAPRPGGAPSGRRHPATASPPISDHIRSPPHHRTTRLTDLATVLDALDQTRRDTEAGGREAFVRQAGLVLQLARLSAEDEEQAIARVKTIEAGLSVRLTTSADLTEARRLCHAAAARLRAAPWFDALLTQWPAPVAHEVRALADTLDGHGRGGVPSPEGALLQLRDTGEAMLKLPASILARRLITLGGPDAHTMRVMVAKASGGNWNDLARTAAERLSQTEPNGPLAGLARLFSNGHRFRAALESLAAARNQYLGHGAMRANPAETAALVAWYAARGPGDPLPQGVRDRPVPLLDGLAAACAENPWEGLRLQAQDGEDVIDLTGAAALDAWRGDPRHHDHGGRVLPVRLTGPGLVLDLGPMVAARVCQECGRRDVFFYDSAERGRHWRSWFLDYANGHRGRINDSDDPGLRAEFAAIGEAIPPQSPAERLTSGAAMLHLDRMRIDQRYQSPGHLRDPLAAFIAGHDRGVFWLQAPAHVGKTTFAQGLAGLLPEEPIAAPRGPEDTALGGGVGVVAFFCRQEFRENQAAFLQGLAGDLRAALGIPERANQLLPTPAEVLNAQDRPAAFVAWLDRWRALSPRPDPRLLVIVDGLDEAVEPRPEEDDPAGEPRVDGSILLLLPRAADLTPGLYVLLTSRPVVAEQASDQAPSWLGPALAGPLTGGVSGIHEGRLDDPGYLALLREYATVNLGALAAVTRVAALIEQADSRFSLFSLLIGQLRVLTADEVAALGSGTEIYSRFIAGLETRFGAKLAADLLGVLAGLAAADLAHARTFNPDTAPRDAMTGAPLVDAATGLPLDVLPVLWPGVSIGLLAETALLDEPADAAGRRYGVALMEALLLLQGALWIWRGGSGVARYRLGLKGFAPALAEHAASSAAVARATARMVSLGLDAVETLHADMVAETNPEPDAEHRLREVFPLLPALVDQAGSDPQRHRYATVPLCDVAQWIEARHGTQIAASARQVTWYNTLIACLHHGGGPADGAPTRDNDLASAFMNRGVAKQSAPGFGAAAAIADYDRAIALREALRDTMGADWPIPWRNDLAGAFVNRGNAKQDTPGFGAAAAIADYDRAVALMETLRDSLGADWPIPWRNDLANAFMNRGNAKQSAPGFGAAAAIGDYDRAIALREALRDTLGADWPIPWRNDLARAYVNRGIASGDKADFARALTLWDALRVLLRDQFPPPWEDAPAFARRMLAGEAGRRPGWWRRLWNR